MEKAKPTDCDQAYEIKKVLNNNVVLVTTVDENQEAVLVGKGLGFSKQPGEKITVDNTNIEKEFISVNEDRAEEYQQLFEKVDNEIIGLTEEIIAMVSSELEEELNEHIHIALADHIAFSVKRIKDGIEIRNPFLPETKTLYDLEYSLAEKAAKMIEERLEINIPEGEIGFITLHIHGARIERGMSRTLKYTQLIKKMVDIVTQELEVTFSYNSLNYARLVTHLRFALERIEKNKVSRNPLLSKVKKDFKESYQIAEKLANLIADELEVKVPDDELGYITIHLERLKKNID